MTPDGGGPRLHSTLTKRREPLVPGPGGVVRIYVCGPTVYGPIHIGNARPFVVFSALKRYLERRGLRVKLVSNLTDVNDKIYDAARAEGVPSAELARRYGGIHRRHRPARPGAAGRRADRHRDRARDPRADRRRWSRRASPTRPAATSTTGSRASPATAASRAAGSTRWSRRSRGPGKESPSTSRSGRGRKQDEDTWWESPWGPGGPGWHIECSAMAEATLGHGFEVHGGGIDLVFPHHENEIAQSEGAHGGRMAAIWMHNEMLELGDEKMSKSVGNIAPLSEVLDRWPAEVVIAFFLTSHYRSRLPFSEERMGEAAAVVERLRNALRPSTGRPPGAARGRTPS